MVLKARKYFPTILLLGLAVAGEQRWTYTIERLEVNNTSPEQMELYLERTFLSRNSYALSGYFDVKGPINDDTTIEILTSRSLTGNTEFKQLPFRIAKQNYVKFLNNDYKDVMMTSLQNCSNLPYFEGEFVPPFETKRYELKNCVIKTDIYPDDVQEGYYKLDGILNGNGLVHAIGIIKIETRIF